MFAGEIASILATKGQRPRIGVLVRFVITLLVMVSVYAVVFRFLMAREGQDQTWVTSFYWVLTVMSTLGFGDITFHTDAGRLFSMLVLASGMLFLLVLLPFLFIEFFYQPWLASQSASRTPRVLKPGTRGHVIITHFDAVTAALIERLDRYHQRYALLVADAEEALRLYDHGYKVVVGEFDNPETYRDLRVDGAALVVATGTDPENTLVASTVLGVAEATRVVATADDAASIDILTLAGCRDVIHLPSLMASSLARRVGGDRCTHTIGAFGELHIAEVNVDGTELVGRTIRESGVRQKTGLGIVGVWDRGAFEPAMPDVVITEGSVLLLAGTAQQLASYDEVFGHRDEPDGLVLVIGGGRVGRLTSRVLTGRRIAHRVVERDATRPGQTEHWVIGNAAELSVLREAGIDEASTVIITTHDDDMNVYLTLYCRKLRESAKILSRATDQRNVASIHRAGADFVLSYASMGAGALFNSLDLGSVMDVAEGLVLFRRRVPDGIHGKLLRDSAIRQRVGATVVALEHSDGRREISPPAETLLKRSQRLILVGSPENEQRFVDEFSA